MASLDMSHQDTISHIEMTAPAARSKPVHLALAGCSSVLLAFNVIAAPPGALVPGIHLFEATILLLPMLLIAPASFHQRGNWERRDSVLMLPWPPVLPALIAQAD